jgi:filamentous hemagglutinin
VATRTISVAGGNWDALTTWDEGIKPVAGDAVVARAGGTSGNLTVNVPSACASIIFTNYVGTLTFNDTLTTTSTVTFVTGMTVAGTAGTLICTGAATLTSGGKTLTCALTLNGSGITYTLGDNWTVNGLVSIGSASGDNVNSNKITCAGGLSILSGGTLGGTATLELTGGTWSNASTALLRNSLSLNGNVTVSGTVFYSTGTLSYASGTITTTGSTLTVGVTGVTTTLDVGSVTWANVTLVAGSTESLTSNLVWSGTLTLSNGTGITLSGAGKPNGTGAVAFSSTATVTLNNTGGLVTTGTMTLPNGALTFAGSAGFTVGTLTTATLNASRIYTLTYGNTYTVTAALGNVGATATVRQALKSGTPGSKVVFTVTP